jgi:hypothetical protein
MREDTTSNKAAEPANEIPAAEPGSGIGEKREGPMRFIDVVLGCVLLGLVVGFLQIARPGTASASSTEAHNAVSERMTWIRMPVMRRTSSIQ